MELEPHGNQEISVSGPQKPDQVNLDPPNESSSISKDTKPKKPEKPLHLHHDLNQLCFEKRERKNVDRFGIGKAETGKAGKVKKERAAKEKEAMGKPEKKEKNGKAEKWKKGGKIKKNGEKDIENGKDSKGKGETMKLESNGNFEARDIGNEEKKEIKDFRETPTNEIKEIIEITEKTEKNVEIPDPELGCQDLKPKVADFNEVNDERQPAEEVRDMNQDPVVSLPIDPIDPLKPPTLLAIDAAPVLKKPKPNKNPLGLVRKRGRKKKAKWGTFKNSFDGGSSMCPTSSLNKIFKKVAGAGVRRPVIAKKVVFSPGLFTNTYKELFLGNSGNEEIVEVPKLEKGSIGESGEVTKNNGPEEEKRDLISLPQDITKIENRNGKENLMGLLNDIQTVNVSFQPVKSFINCDLRYFNFNFLVEKIGYFDIILMDPPWRIKGGQQNDSQFMFSNNKFSLDYNTMSNQAILNIPIQKLSQKGFIFLWILNTQMNVGYEMLNKWGYEVIDQIIWVKLKDNKIFMTHGYYFMHSFEICLVGYKCPIGEYVEYHSKVSNNLIFAEVRKKSQKPDELYEIIDLLMPGAKKIELFARNNNLRSGWLSLGNQLGETFDKWLNILECNNCHKNILKGVKRYKSRKIHNYDLCKDCMTSLNLNPEDFFEMRNDIDEDVLHHYHKCNQCEAEPIWGIRFACQDCENYDLCEACFDENLSKEQPFHCIEHKIMALELPLLANGLPAHCDNKCNGCFQKPIIGPCFSCTVCNNFSLCQSCFFIKNDCEFINSKNHKPIHKMEIKIEPDSTKKKGVKCAFCELDLVEGPIFKCENCFNFYFCIRCYDKKQEFRTNMATTHKPYHNFVKLL